jgi:hypothetical protein
MFLFDIDLTSSHFSRSLSQISNDETSIEARQEGKSTQDLSRKIMAPWTFSIKFPYVTQFTFRSLMYVTGEDEILELLTQGPTPKYLAPVYGRAPYLPASSSTSGGNCSGLNPYVGTYHRAAKTTQGLPIRVHIF